MANWIFLTVYFMLLLAPTSAEWAQSDLVVKQGDTLTVECTVDFRDALIGVMRVAKINDNPDNGGVRESVILENDVFKKLYKNTTRYKLKYNSTKDKGTVHLTFEGIRGEDGGKLVCYNLVEKVDPAEINIKVQVPVKEVKMVKISDANEVDAANGVTVHLREGTQSGVGCVVTVDGSLTAPEVTVFINGENETSLFTRLVDSQRMVSVQGGPDRYFTEVKYTYINVKPSSEFNQRDLTCTAKADGFEPVTADVFLDVKYKPVLTCSKYEHFATVGKSAELNCVLRANPGATVTWSYGPDEESATEVVPGNTPALTTQEQPFDEDKTDVSLMISLVDESHFTNYYLTATNEIGTSSTFVSLQKGAETTPPPTPKPKPDPPSNSQGTDPKADQVQGNTSSRPVASVSVVLSLLSALLTVLRLHTL